MPSLKEVRNRISSVNSTQQITKAMKMVAAAKLKRAQDNILKIRPYADKLGVILKNISNNIDTSKVENLFAEERTIEKVLVIVITSDRGLAGAFNANVIKASVALVNEKYSDLEAKGNVTYLCVGKKGLDFYSKRNAPVINDYVGTFLNLSFEKSRVIAEYAMNSFVDGTFDCVEIVYNEFKNVATQAVVKSQFLPIAQDTQKLASNVSDVDYIYEPSKEFIVKELIPKSLKIEFYKALLESNASEHGARMTAMDKATDNAKELLKELRLSYNRSRQAAITKEILEIVGGAEALKA
ncbi:MAG: ATP synthase F1 subunit gamma [Cytophagales bacterium]|nr:MAG: ATP synthase F1 subunit gamma [Cytophagales bacterium]